MAFVLIFRTKAYFLPPPVYPYSKKNARHKTGEIFRPLPPASCVTASSDRGFYGLPSGGG